MSNINPARRMHLYVVQCEVTRLVKIGHTMDVTGRMRGLRSTSPTPLTLLSLYATDDAKAVELGIHHDAVDPLRYFAFTANQ